MDSVHLKPKLVFFQYNYDDQLPDFLVTHARDHVKCLSECFEVAVIRGKCDYQQICDMHQPALTLFESGVNLLTCQRPEVTNIRACPHVPRVGLLNADAWCETRSGILSDMDHWGIDTFFTIATTAAEHAPEIAANLFVWPNCIDPATYHDYNSPKLIPILLTGSQGPQYPWRRRVHKLVSEYYPSFSCPHHGYLSRPGAGQLLHGEQYASVINASLVAPVCGTVAREVVRKHFEIPGCNTCMITEESPALQAAGFADMKNCVFADEHNILDKLAYLFERPGDLLAITRAGYQLVHSRHTLRHRSQLFQWFTLYKDLSPNHTIIQPGPFDPLIALDKSRGIASAHVRCDGLHLRLLRQGDEKLWAGEYETADTLYRTCLTYMRALPEARFKSALCNLYKGNARRASQLLFELVQYTLSEYKALDPDPVEWAYYVISLLCCGSVQRASMHATHFPWLHHPELDRTRWLMNELTHGASDVEVVKGEQVKQRSTIHQLPHRSTKEWVKCVCEVLKACHQPGLAEKVMQSLPGDSQPLGVETSASRDVSVKSIGYWNDTAQNKSWITDKKTGVGALKRRFIYYRVRRKLSTSVEPVSRRLRAVYCKLRGYGGVKARNNRLSRAIRKLAGEEDVRTALVIGAAVGDDGIDELLASCRRNNKELSVLCISHAQSGVVTSHELSARRPVLRWYQLPASCAAEVSVELEETIRDIKESNRAMRFDLVLMNATDIGPEVAGNVRLNKELNAARYVVLEDIRGYYNCDKYRELLGSLQHCVVDLDSDATNGYAIFRQQDHADGKWNVATSLSEQAAD